MQASGYEKKINWRDRERKRMRQKSTCELIENEGAERKEKEREREREREREKERRFVAYRRASTDARRRGMHPGDSLSRSSHCCVLRCCCCSPGFCFTRYITKTHTRNRETSGYIFKRGANHSSSSSLSETSDALRRRASSSRSLRHPTCTFYKTN